MKFKKINISNINKLYLLLFSALFIRIILFCIYAPNVYPDTGWYEKLAKEISTLNFSEYDGARTPVYPIFLILGFIKWKIIWIIQLIVGVANSLLIYFIIFKATKDQNYSFWSGLCYNFSLILLFFESNILTETICIFFLLLSVHYFQKITEKTPTNTVNRITDYLILSLTVSLAALTRPTFVYIFPLLLIFLIYDFYKHKEQKGNLFKKLLFYIIPFLILAGGWSIFNKIKTDYFGLTTLTGFHLIEHSGAFIEYAPEEYSELKELYLKYRKIKILETGEQTTTIYLVYPEIQKNKGYSIARISKELTAVSLWLFLHQPQLYIKSVIRAFFDFWLFPNFIEYWDLNKIRFKIFQIPLGYGIKLELYLWFVLNILFISGSILFFFLRKLRNTKGKLTIYYLTSTVFILSIIQALVQYGDNWRFSIAVKPFILLTLILLVYNIKHPPKENPGTT